MRLPSPPIPSGGDVDHRVAFHGSAHELSAGSDGQAEVDTPKRLALLGWAVDDALAGEVQQPVHDRLGLGQGAHRVGGVQAGSETFEGTNLLFPYLLSTARASAPRRPRSTPDGHGVARQCCSDRVVRRRPGWRQSRSPPPFGRGASAMSRWSGYPVNLAGAFIGAGAFGACGAAGFVSGGFVSGGAVGGTKPGGTQPLL